jgi:hypothetical protein
MGTVLQFGETETKRSRSDRAPLAGECRIVIFPGVRIERHDDNPRLDLGHRLRDSAGHDSFDGINGGRRPRKSS